MGHARRLAVQQNVSYAAPMKLGFEESQTAYISGTQKARAWTEAWVKAQAYCPHCGSTEMSQFPNNTPLADFLCTRCKEEFELKSQKGKFGAAVADGAYKTKCERIAASNNSEPASDELRLEIARCGEPVHRTEAFLRS